MIYQLAAENGLNKTEIAVKNIIFFRGKTYFMAISKLDTIKERKTKFILKILIKTILKLILLIRSPLFSVQPMVIVGWYKNATVYRYRQEAEYFGSINQFNIIAKSENAYLLPECSRTKEVPTGKDGFGERNYWYAEHYPEYIEEVLKYIKKTEEEIKESIKADIDYLNSIYANTEIDKTERDIIAKERIGQGTFRNQLIARDGCCRICGMRNQKLLVAMCLSSRKCIKGARKSA